ncbi:uncharacterized protein LOC131687579 [Topomyia yanbarensis]|uniref:uncharacterized protein LOC131687579 n=1 Tax=Topomyia yanbarensis TaxID=2498891 RepID=UPI00273A9D3C|nr:uncharacterized protein LOC131687579 [Topomyia yanbarensis]
MASGGYAHNPNGNCRLCKDKDSADEWMIECSKCWNWFHMTCTKLEKRPSTKDLWHCPKCKEEIMELQQLRKELEDQKKKTTRSVSKERGPADTVERLRRQFEAQMESQKLRDEAFQKAMIEMATKMHQVKMDPEAGQQMAPTIKLPDEITNLLRRQTATPLPVFNGNYKDWPNFKRLYEQSKREGQFSDTDNINRLMASLGKAAKVHVSALLMDPGNEKHVVETLDSIYGQPLAIYNELWKDLAKLRNPRMEYPQSMVDFVVTLGNSVSNMSMIQCEDYLTNPLQMAELVCRLPLNLREQWADKEAEAMIPQEGRPRQKLTLKELHEFLKPQQQRATLLIAQKVCQSEKENPKNERQSRVNMHAETTSRSQAKCSCCSQQHWIVACPVFKKMSVEKRRELALEKRMCFNCLRQGHSFRNCQMRPNCRTEGCTAHHHTFLHVRPKTNDEKRASQKEETKQKIKESSGHSKDNKKNQDKKEVKEIDAQAPTSSTSKEQEDEAVRTNIHATKRNKVYYQILPVTLYAQGRQLETFAFLDHGSSNSLILDDLTKDLGLQGPVSPLCIKWTNDSVHEDNESQSVCFKISGDNEIRYQMESVRTVKKLSLPRQTLDYKDLHENYNHLKNLPIQGYENAEPTLLIGLDHPRLLTATKQRASKVGPVAAKTPIGWVIYGRTNSRHQGEIYSCVVEEQDSLREEMRKYFSTEEFGVKVSTTNQQSEEDRRAEKLIKETMKYDGSQYEIGLLWKQARPIMPKSESFKGALKRLEYTETKMRKNPEFAQWYTDKIKEYVEKGYARKLTANEITLTTDKTYYLPHFAVVNPNKTPLKPRLVFDAAAKVQGLSLNTELLSGPDNLTSLFGILLRFREGKCAVAGDIQEMFSQIKIRKEDQEAQRFLWRDVKNANAENYRDCDPVAANAIIKQHYVDDYLDSFSTAEEASAVTFGVIKIHEAAHFTLRNITSNDAEMLDVLPERNVARQSTQKEFIEKTATSEKVLGVYWDTTQDTIGYRIADFKSNAIPTKREVLSTIARIFDPLGLIAHITIGGKLLMQQAWKEESAFAAAAYIRAETLHGYDVSLIAAKTRVAPNKAMSIPRLELQAAVLGTRLKTTVLKELRLNITNVTMWTDSTTVLSWIRSDHRRYKTFVANRVSEILDDTTISQWRWVPSGMNPADEATRNIQPTESIWYTRATYLNTKVESWPKEKGAVIETSEEKRVCSVQEIQPANIIMHTTWCSDWGRLKKAVCYWLKYMEKLRTKVSNSRYYETITSDHYKRAEILLLQQAQQEAFPSELVALINGEGIYQNSSVADHELALDENRLIRISGRIQNMTPVLLPNKGI